MLQMRNGTFFHFAYHGRVNADMFSVFSLETISTPAHEVRKHAELFML